VGESVQLAVGSTQLLLYREDEETVHAYSAICTHQGCIVGVGENAPAKPFVCPCHASAFDRTTGEPVAGPAPSPLLRHPTSIKDGWVHVEVESTD
jgi:Rieske Fe-S protein